MKRNTRKVAGALALAVALGGVSPVLTASAAHTKPAHTKPAHIKAAHSKAGHADKKGGQKVGQALRKVLREVENLDRRLVHVARESRTSRLAEADAAAVRTNIAADRQALADLVASVQSGDSTADLADLRDALKDLRPQNYGQVVNDLRHAARLAARVAAARTALDGDIAAPATELNAAQAAIDAAVAKALAVTAWSNRSARGAVKADLRAADEAFDVVAAYLESYAEAPAEEETVGQ